MPDFSEKTVGDARLFLGDWFDVASQIEKESVNLCFVDPPYNIGIFTKMLHDEYLAWCKPWIALCSEKLTANGAFWICHKNPDVLVELSRMVAKHGRKRVNWVTWDKYNGSSPGVQYMMNRTKLHPQGKRSFDADAEYLIYHADEGEWTTQCDNERGFIFEPLRIYLSQERDRAGFTTRQVAEAFQQKTGSRTVTGMAGHWLDRAQWNLPTHENYLWLRDLFNQGNGSKYLRREYEDLRREFENLRYTFNNPGLVSSVWQIPPASKNGHPTPKPLALLERIILATSNEGDVILDPMMGRGTTGEAAIKHGRLFVGCELDKSHFEYACKRVHGVLCKAEQMAMAID